MSPPSKSSTVRQPSDSSTSSSSTEVTPPESDDNDQTSQTSEEEDDTEEEDEHHVQVQQSPPALAVPATAPSAVADQSSQSSEEEDDVHVHVQQAPLALAVPDTLDEAASPPLAAVPVSSIKKIWDVPMQILLLKEMIDFSKTNGGCKISKSYVTMFRSSLKGSPIIKFSANQMLEKMKAIKKRYDNPNGMGKGKDVELLELSHKLWGGDRRMVESRKRKRTKNDSGGDGDSLIDNVGKDLGDFVVKLVKARIGFSEEDNVKGKVASSKKKIDGLEKLFSLMGEMVEVIVDVIGMEK